MVLNRVLVEVQRLENATEKRSAEWLLRIFKNVLNYQTLMKHILAAFLLTSAYQTASAQSFLETLGSGDLRL